jgi:hypothetical protein
VLRHVAALEHADHDPAQSTRRASLLAAMEALAESAERLDRDDRAPGA